MSSNMSSNMSNDRGDKETIYEVKKELSVSNIMQLIDLNGTKKNFQSQFILETKDPSKKINICVVNQDELDNGKIIFEETERGKYSRRVTFQNDKHVNHYIAVKKHQEDKDESNVECLLIIHMKELPPPLKPVLEESYDQEYKEQYNLNPNMNMQTKEDIRKQLFNLRETKEYKDSPDVNNNDMNDNANSINNKNSLRNMSSSEYVPIKKKSQPSSIMNSYFFVGIIFLCIFAYIFYTKKIKK